MHRCLTISEILCAIIASLYDEGTFTETDPQHWQRLTPLLPGDPWVYNSVPHLHQTSGQEARRRNSTILAIALTCRSFLEPALDFLWETQDVRLLVTYLPPNIFDMRKDPQSEYTRCIKWNANRDIVAKDMDRFRYYSRRIRVLRMTSHAIIRELGPDGHIHDKVEEVEGLLLAAKKFFDEAPALIPDFFPRIRTLELALCASPSALGFEFATLLSRHCQLRSLTFNLWYDWWTDLRRPRKWLPEETMHLRTLMQVAPLVKRVHVDYFPEEIRSVLQFPVPAILEERADMEYLALPWFKPLHPSVLPHLARFRDLRSLELGLLSPFYHFDDEPVEFTEVCPGSFPSLRVLKVALHGKGSWPMLSRFIRHAPLESLLITQRLCFHSSVDETLSLPPYDLPETLSVFSLVFEDIPLSDSRIYRGDIVLSPSLFDPLLRLKNLQELVLSGYTEGIDFNDVFLYELASALPRLRLLDVSMVNTGDRSSITTLGGLVALARACKELSYIGMNVNQDAEDVLSSAWADEPFMQVETLVVGYASSVTDHEAVAGFLKMMFPRLKTVSPLRSKPVGPPLRSSYLAWYKIQELFADSN